MEMERFAKSFNESGESCGLTNNDFHKALEKRALGSRRVGESFAQAYSRESTETPEGRELFKAAVRAPAPVQAAQDLVPRRKPEPLGPAARELQDIADKMAQAKGISRVKATGKIMSDPEHGPLVRRVLAEELTTTDEVKRQRWSLPAKA
jgi:hypothetical protein